MRLKSHEGVCELELGITSYQFPERGNDYGPNGLNNAYDDDANWLNIKVEATSPEGSWTATSPALLTYEVEKLIRWLRQIGTGIYEGRGLNFWEPNLWFGIEKDSSSSLLVKIDLEMEFPPPWRNPGRVRYGGNTHTLTFRLAPVDFVNAADVLESQYRKFPMKGSFN